ncbi:MAG TPA: 2TM domain-containing protein [Caldimonas sp.]|jgi:hypothetical protein|nr:2TM domain-containing protein [Caldimonas sp.]HEX2543160.1 2TM domain-containing protein [Caldimonas sp.]
MNTSSSSLTPDDLDGLARRRAGMLAGWLVHATVFVLVNILLATLSFMNGRTWALYPFFGWGLGLAIHGMVVLMSRLGGGFMGRLVQRERELLARRNA